MDDNFNWEWRGPKHRKSKVIPINHTHRANETARSQRHFYNFTCCHTPTSHHPDRRHGQLSEHPNGQTHCSVQQAAPARRAGLSHSVIRGGVQCRKTEKFLQETAMVLSIGYRYVTLSSLISLINVRYKTNHVVSRFITRYHKEISFMFHLVSRFSIHHTDRSCVLRTI